MPTARFVLALDQGTTSSRALLFDHQGQVVSQVQREFEQIFPHPGWVEHNAEEIFQSQLGVAEEAIRQAGVTAAEVAALGIANQRETTVVWDRASGQPIHNAIVWQDRRTADAIEALKAAGHASYTREHTGLVLDAYFSASKVAWILDHVVDGRRRADAGELAFGTIDTWLLFRLTGGAVHATDPSNASRTLLYDIHASSWDTGMLEMFDLPASLLPDVRGSSQVVGIVGIESPLKGLPIAGILGDQQAALAGQFCFAPGTAKCTYGTGCFILLNTGDDAVESHQRLLSTVAWRLEPQPTYALEGSVFVGGAVVQWLRDGLHLVKTATDIEHLAASVPDSDSVYLVPAFTGLGAPHWDPYARGTLCGLTRGTSAAHIARAALDGIAFQVADLVDAMRADTGLAIAELRVDGGAAANDLLLQIQADLLQIPIVRPEVTESTALGAALMAGLATGFWSAPGDVADGRRGDRVFEPRMSLAEARRRRDRWADAVERAKGWEPRA